MDETLRNPFAELNSPDSGILVTAHESGWHRHYYCPHSNCLDPERRLFRKRSKNGRYFFSHYAKFEHPIGPETLLHKVAIGYFKELLEFELPKLNGKIETIKLNQGCTVVEYNGLKKIKPDIKLISQSGEVYFIEIFVTHETKGRKMSIIHEYVTPTIEIDLSGFYSLNKESCKYDLTFVKSKVPKLISNIQLKKWLYPVENILEQPIIELKLQPAGLDDRPPQLQPAASNTTQGEKVSSGFNWYWMGGIVAFAFFVFPSFRKTMAGILRPFKRRR